MRQNIFEFLVGKMIIANKKDLDYDPFIYFELDADYNYIDDLDEQNVVFLSFDGKFLEVVKIEDDIDKAEDCAITHYFINTDKIAGLVSAQNTTIPECLEKIPFDANEHDFDFLNLKEYYWKHQREYEKEIDESAKELTKNE